MNYLTKKQREYLIDFKHILSVYNGQFMDEALALSQYDGDDVRSYIFGLINTIIYDGYYKNWHKQQLNNLRETYIKLKETHDQPFVAKVTVDYGTHIDDVSGYFTFDYDSEIQKSINAIQADLDVEIEKIKNGT